jgi:lipopolysaccharide transport system permease protein
MRELFSAVWAYRIFIVASIRGELKGRFARSKLGALWFVLNPLAQAAIFAVVLSEMLGARLGGSTDKAAYPVYLMSGMAAWGLFSEIVNRCLNIFLEFGPTLKKIAFPRICLPIIAFVVFLMLGHKPGMAWFVLPIGLILISMLAFGLGVLLGVFNVFSRDVAQVFSVVLQIWFWLTPVVYTHDLVPPSVAWLVGLNPMTSLVRVYQDAILRNQWPTLVDLAWPTILAVVLLGAAFVIFRKASPELVDVL